jgi:hypothetical protein
VKEAQAARAGRVDAKLDRALRVLPRESSSRFGIPPAAAAASRVRFGETTGVRTYDPGAAVMSGALGSTVRQGGRPGHTR